VYNLDRLSQYFFERGNPTLLNNLAARTRCIAVWVVSQGWWKIGELTQAADCKFFLENRSRPAHRLPVQHPPPEKKFGPICEREAPPVHEFADGHRIACHIPLDELRRSEAVIQTIK
jgi:hypothetical protein